MGFLRPQAEITWIWKLRTRSGRGRTKKAQIPVAVKVIAREANQQWSVGLRVSPLYASSSLIHHAKSCQRPSSHPYHALTHPQR